MRLRQNQCHDRTKQQRKRNGADGRLLHPVKILVDEECEEDHDGEFRQL